MRLLRLYEREAGPGPLRARMIRGARANGAAPLPPDRLAVLLAMIGCCRARPARLPAPSGPVAPRQPQSLRPRRLSRVLLVGMRASKPASRREVFDLQDENDRSNMYQTVPSESVPNICS